MINVVVVMSIKEDCLSDFLILCKEFREKVLHEKGCVSYDYFIPADDERFNYAGQKNEVVLIEKWETVEDLIEHGKTSAMKQFKEDVRSLRKDTSVRVMQAAF